MSTSCEYKPVQRTRLNSEFFEGRLLVICGKYAISCFGGSLEGVGNSAMVAEVELNGLDEGACEDFERTCREDTAEARRDGLRI